MLALLINKFKKILFMLIVASLILASFTEIMHAQDNKITEMETAKIDSQYRQYEVIIRAGEYEGKCGKRIYINNCTVNIPDDIPVRNDGDGKGFYISEWDINVKEAKALVEELRARGINAKLQIAYSKSEDLNAAARIANKSNPYLYVSIHHNYYEANSRGYFSMYNADDAKAKAVADRLSDSISKNGLVPQKQNAPNTGYIGELNNINPSTTAVLLELGFFSNLEELEIICSDNYVCYVSNRLADEIANIINSQYR